MITHAKHVSDSASMTSPLFTPQRMGITAHVIVALDLFLAVVWVAGIVYILIAFPSPCFVEQFVTHFLILFHFVLGLTIAGIGSQIESAEYDHQEKQRTLSDDPNVRVEPLRYVPYQIYSPLKWIFAALISTAGDTALLVAAIKAYQSASTSVPDECATSRILHITYDSVALVISLATVLWFILFGAYVIAPQRRWHHDEERRQNAARLLQKQQQQQRLPSPISPSGYIIPTLRQRMAQRF